MDSEQQAIARAHEKLQTIILQVIDADVGDEPSVVRAELVRRITEAGLTPPPDKWLTDTSVEVAAGSLVVMDARISREAEVAPDQDARDDES